MNKSIGFYSVRYAVFYVIMIAVVVAITYAAYTFVPDLADTIFSGGGGSGVGVVTLILPPMLVAQAFYKNEGRAMTRGEGWKLAFIFTVLAFLLSAVVFWGGTFIEPLSQQESSEMNMLFNEERDILVIVVAFAAVFVLLTNMLMLWSGVRGEVKKAEKIAAKAARKG